MIKLKSCVNIDGMTKECFKAISIVHDYFYIYRDEDLTVTSIADGNHKMGSKHYDGDAFDVRTWDYTKPLGTQLDMVEKLGIATELTARLGVNYDVVIESTHLHIEYDPVEDNR